MSCLEVKTPRQGRRSEVVSRQSEAARMACTVAPGRELVMEVGVLAIVRRVEVGTLRMTWFAWKDHVSAIESVVCEGGW